MFKGKKITIIGGGNMGEVIAAGIVSAGLIPATDITITDLV
ncbi:MAG: NAD(P)-binding domain-containing protein, partial [Deltaproteobacteria bacterium]|nr:NAD(P)-binding domain-containing protein [Deltaproteobacteria bacterium]